MTKKTIFRVTLFLLKDVQVSQQLNSCFLFQIQYVCKFVGKSKIKMRSNFIYFLCICTFLRGNPFLEALPTTLENEDSCQSCKLLKEQFAVMRQELNDSLMVQKKMLENIQKLMKRHFISHIDPLACFDKSVSHDSPYCRAGWLVIQRRMDGSVDFYRGWSDYRQGFGDTSDEFWIGLETMHSLTQSRTYKLRIDLEDFEGNTRYAEYSTFAISDEAHGYTLSIGTYSGTAGDALTYHKNQPFLTKDHRGTGHSARCPVKYKGAWWYNNCHDSNLNGPYLRGNHTSYANGVNWAQWKGYHHSLKTTIMMIQPVG